MAHKLLTEITEYCAAAGISPSTLGVRALGNSRFFERLKRRSEQVERDADRVRAFMRAHPPQAREGAE